MRKNMPKAISVPPPIPKADIPKEGIKVVLHNVRPVRNQWTSIGTLTLGVGGQVTIADEEYSFLFSLDRDPITGSIGRLLVAAGIDEITDKTANEQLKKLEGLECTIKNRGGKLYWYP